MLEIRADPLENEEVAAFLREHLAEMRSVSPPESTHALDLDGLRRADVEFWTVWEGARLVGCGALRRLDAGHGEIKSMRTAARSRGGGVASALLGFMIGHAARSGIRRLSLETGSMAFFEPARRLYAKFGFRECGPFGSYRPDANSVFMTMEIGDGGETARDGAGI